MLPNGATYQITAYATHPKKTELGMRASLSLWFLTLSFPFGCRGTDGLICGEGTHEVDGSCVADEEADTDTDPDTDPDARPRLRTIVRVDSPR